MSAGATIRLRRDTAADWATANPILALGEPGLETDTTLIKYGDGVTRWNSLPYAGASLSNVDSNVVPTDNVTYSLGTDTNRFSELYLSGNSIYLGNIVLSEDNGELSVNGSIVPNANNTLSNKGADTNNWNTLTAMGLYTVNRNSWSGVTGAPLDSQIFVGTLQVLYTSDNTTTFITQNFYPGEQNPNNAAVQFTRSKSNTSWTYWQKILNTQQIVSGGEF